MGGRLIWIKFASLNRRTADLRERPRIYYKRVETSENAFPLARIGAFSLSKPRSALADFAQCKSSTLS